MPSLGDIARLNVLIELFSECAGAPDLETLVRVAAGRLRWVIDFDRCSFVLTMEGGFECWVATRADETIRLCALADLPPTEATLVRRVLEIGVPAAEPPGTICAPLQIMRQTLGAVCFATEGVPYTYRDMRLGHHAGQYLGALVSRMNLEAETRGFSRRKDELLAVLSHELRNPLAPIVTAVHLLKAREDGRSTKELDIIDRQAQHLVRLVDDLMDVARLTRGKVVLQRMPLEIARVIARAVAMAKPLLDQRRHTLAVEVPAAGLLVDADEDRLAQVVSNLLTNAAHYTNEGGQVAVRARLDAASVVVEVSDDGIGIAPAALGHIFDLFVQGPRRSSGQGGLGLGLVVVKELTELHGGSISVASGDGGRGTKFTIRLPSLPTGTVARVAAPPLSSTRPGTSRRVLVVDDNADALSLLATFLEDAGHEVSAAPDGREALAAFDRFHPSAAVIDLSMPVMDGHELARRIRAAQGDASPYLVALTGYGQPSDRERTRAAGFDEHLVKPVDLDQLLRVIARAGPA